mgnify:CR=1 FL=1
MSNSVYIIGDVHGCRAELEALLRKLPASATKVLVGDLIDRGLDSAGVCRLVRAEGLLTVRGNHEQLACSSDKDLWVYNGGGATLASYEDDAELAEHQAWWSQLPLTLEFPDLKNEAGLWLQVSHSVAHKQRAGWDDPESEQGVLWSRTFPRKLRAGQAEFQVFGHTPAKGVVKGPGWACIDGGCVYGGKLIAVSWPSLEEVSVRRGER